MSDIIILIKLILNILFIFIFNDSFIIRLLWGCLFFGLSYSLWRLKKYYDLKIEDLNVKSLRVTLCIIMGYFIGFVCLLFIYKVLHISREVDLKHIYNIAKTFYKENDYFLLFSTGFLFLNIFLLGFIILAIIKAIIFKHFMRLDLLCINYYPLDVNRQDNPTPYDKFKSTFTELINKLVNMFCYIKYLFPPHYRSGVCDFLFSWYAYFGLFICILLLAYDILFNNFIIYKLYYGLPCIFLYQLLLIMSRFQILLPTEENILCCILYHNLIHYDAEKKIYYFSNNYCFNQEDLDEVTILVKCNFNRNLALKKAFEHKKDIYNGINPHASTSASGTSNVNTNSLSNSHSQSNGNIPTPPLPPSNPVSNIPLPPPMPPSPKASSIKSSQPITNEAFQQHQTLKKLDDLIKEGVDEKLLGYADAPQNPHTGKFQMTPLGSTYYKFLSKLLLTIIGAILLIAYIWYRFIRQRLPKDIPFHLTEYGCIILIYICCIYLMIY